MLVAILSWLRAGWFGLSCLPGLVGVWLVELLGLLFDLGLCCRRCGYLCLGLLFRWAGLLFDLLVCLGVSFNGMRLCGCCIRL